MLMRYLEIPQRLRRLPEKQSILLVASIFLCSLLVMMVGMLKMHTMGFAPFFVLPLTLATWVAKTRMTLFWYAMTTVVLAACNTLFTGTLSWPMSTEIAFFSGLLALIFVAGGVLAFKYVFDLLAQARSQSDLCPMTPVEQLDESLYQANCLARSLPEELSPLVRESLQEQTDALRVELRKRGIDL